MGTLGAYDATAYAINTAGEIVGSRRFYNPPILDRSEAYIRNTAGGITSFGTAGAFSTNFAVDINDNGDVVGVANNIAFIRHPGGNLIELGTLGGSTSEATGVNDLGFVTGNSVNSLGEIHAFFGNEAGLIDLGTLGGAGARSFGYGINDNNQIVGLSEDAEGITRAFYWDETDGMLDLSSLVSNISGWDRLIEARDISDTGYIVGTGITSSGVERAFLLTPFDPPVELIVDNTGVCIGPVAAWIPINYDILFFIPGPGVNWTLETVLNDKYGQDYYSLSGGSNNGKPEFEWSFTVPTTGVYAVDAWWPQDSNGTTSANYTVTSTFGDTVVTVQQNINGSQWNELGNYTFDEGQTYHVTLSAPSGEPVIADAIRVRN